MSAEGAYLDRSAYCERAFLALKQRVVAAAYTARDPATLLAVQRDLVTAAQRLEARCAEVGASPLLTAEVCGYRVAAEQVLARLEARQEVPGERIQLP